MQAPLLLASGPLKNSMKAIDRLDILPGHFVLDLGCGDGYHSTYAQNMSPGQIVRLDIDLANLRSLAPTISVDNVTIKATDSPRVCANALKLPFSDGSFDRVICSLVFYFLPFEEALIELNRVVKAGGRVYLRVPLLGGERFIYIMKTLFSRPRLSIYHFLLTVNGVYYSLSGNQFSNPLLRNDHWAFYVPRHRFEKALIKSGFLLEAFWLDKPSASAVAIDSWLRKI